MSENWRAIADYEGRYEVSDHGSVRSMPFMQRYLLRTGVEAFRRTKQRLLSQCLINSGYLTVSLWLDNEGTRHLVHRLVAEAFLPPPFGETVNHKHPSGDKTNNHIDNLEWATYTENHLHAVRHQLRFAIRVIDPATGIQYDSINQAARSVHMAHRYISALFIKVPR